MDAATTVSREVSLQPDELIITKTDPKGHISYANRVFMRISQYAEPQLLGQPHNLIRHPDMPRGVFRLLWKTLQAGNEFFGVIKNYTADGNYYWVMANVTPDYDRNGQLMGYYSVRRCATRKAIDVMTELYRTMRDIEAGTGKAAAPDASVAWLLEEVKRRQYSSFENMVLELNKPAASGEAKR